MSYETLINFLAANPLVLAIASLITLWPVTKALISNGIKVWHWYFQKVTIDPAETELAAKNVNFLVSTLVIYLLIFAGSLVLAYFSLSISEALRASPPTGPTTAARWLTTLLIYLSGLLSGSMIANIGILVLQVRAKIRRNESSETT